MLKVYPLVDLGSGWYPKNSFEEFTRHCKEVEFTAKIKDADVVWIYSYYVSLRKILQITSFLNFRSHDAIIKRRTWLQKKPTVASIHHLTPWKESEFIRKIRQINAVSDCVHFFSQKSLTDNHKYFDKPTCYLPYWINPQKFFPLTAHVRKRLREKYHLSANKIVIGSFQRDTESDGVSPKLEKGPDVFCEVLEGLGARNAMVVLAGPRRQYVVDRLNQSGFELLDLGKVSHTAMNELYNLLDYYLVTSRVEGGPQAILECMATRTRILSTDVGIANNLSSNMICASSKDFLSAISSPYPRGVLGDHFEKIHTYFDVQRVVPLYEKWFEHMYVSAGS